MPISDPWTSTNQILDEFGATNQPDDGLDAWSRIFDVAPSTNQSWADNFEGLGKPSISGFTATTSNTLDGYIDIDFTLTTNGLTARVYVQYQENNGSVPDPGSWLQSGLYSYGTDGAKVIDFQVPKANQSYHVRLVFYNLFNDQASSDYLSVTYDTATSSDTGTLATPQSLSITVGANSIDLDWTDTNDGTFTDDYRVEVIRSNQDGDVTTYYSGADWTSTTGWNSSGAKSGTIALGYFIDQGDSFEVRIRAMDDDNVKNDSDWSLPDTAG